jgi:hypothetical protein
VNCSNCSATCSMSLSAEQLASFAREGHVTIPNAVSADAVDRARAYV